MKYLMFSIYPLTQGFKEKVERAFQITEMDANYFDLSNIRKKGFLGAILFFFKRTEEKMFLISEATESEELIPVLKSFALFTRVKSIYIVTDELSLVKVSRFKILFSLVKILGATIHGFYSVVVANIETYFLDKTRKTKPSQGKGDGVLYLNMNLWYGVKVGGSVGHIAGVANEFNNRGYKVSYGAISNSNSLSHDITRELLKSPKTFGLPPEVNSYRLERYNKRNLAAVAKKMQPSFIYQRLSVCSYLGVKLARENKIPLIVEYNGSEVWIAKNWGRPLIFHKTAKRAEDVMLKEASVVVTISDVLKEELIDRGIEASKIACYPNCIDPHFFDPARFTAEAKNSLRKQLGVNQNTLLITFLGTFGQWHGVDILAKAICAMVKDNKDILDRYDVKFMLVGDGLKMSNVREILNEGNAEQYCLLTGLIPQQEAPLYLAISDILASPHVKNPDGTRFFGSPTKLFEYLAMGKAIVASDLDQIGEVLNNSIHIDAPETIEKVGEKARVAMLVEPGDVQKLVLALKMLIGDAELRNLLGKNARDLALKKYTWQTHVDAIFDKMIGDSVTVDE